VTTNDPKARVLSGMRSTGKLHLGNYVGALENWVKLQDSGKYDCFFFIADWHALTTDYADTSRVKENSLEVALDWLAAGLDPEKSVLFIQSHVPQHAELFLLFSMITPLGWLERVPTYKEQRDNIQDKDLGTYGFLGYPLLQSADILLYGVPGIADPAKDHPLYVPVGEDQVAHIELTREVARRFNNFYAMEIRRALHAEVPGLGKAHIELPPGVKATGTPGFSTVMESKKYVFSEPQPLLTPAARLRGSDGRKMSKSYNNSILLSDTPQAIEAKITSYVTDRPTRDVAGEPTNCPVGDLHLYFSDSSTKDAAFAGCRAASISCQECKAMVTRNVVERLAPIRERREAFAKDPSTAWQILQRGSEKARQAASKTLESTRAAMGMSHSFDSLLGTFPGSRRSASALLNLPFQETEAIPDHEKRGDLRRGQWLRFISREIELKKTDVSRVFTTPRNKRVAVVTAGEQSDRSFTFLPRDRTYEVLVLLFHLRTGEIADIIIPTRALQAFWRKLERRDKSVEMRAEVRNGRFLLRVPGQPETDLSALKSQYEPLK
jgi:tryptophanyl-tRNA synthetase